MPSFDVAIPSYNYGRYLGDCVRSVLAQDVEPLRVLIVDNASNDDSLRVARELAAGDARVEVRVHARNLGYHSSFNEGIDWAAADYFQIVCADDLLVPGALRRASEVLEADPEIAFCFGRDLAFGAGVGPAPAEGRSDPPRSRRIAGRDFIEDACRRGAMDTPTASVTIRTRHLKRAGHFRQLKFEDHEFWLRLAALGDAVQLENVQAAKRYHSTNWEWSVAPTHLSRIVHVAEAVESFFSNEGSALPEHKRLHRLARRGLAARAYWGAFAAWARGSESGRDLLAYSVRNWPSMTIIPPLGYLWHRKDSVSRIVAGLQSMGRAGPGLSR